MFKKKISWAMALAFSMPGLIAPALAQDTRDVVLVVPNPSAVLIAPVAVAISQGYFADEGLKVSVEAVNGSGAVLQALASGQAQIGNPGAGPFLSARLNNFDVKFLYRLNPNSSFGLVVQSEQAYKAPADLAGKVIGVGTADGAETAFARSIFDDAGMKEGTDYTFLVVGDGGQAIAGFLRGDIDAYVAATNDSAIISSRGMALRNITPEKFRVYFGNGLVAMTSYIEANPDVIEAFGRAVVRGAKFTADPANIEAVIDATGALNPQEAEDRAFAKSLIEQIIIRQTPFDMSKGYGYQDQEAWDAWHESLIASGELSKPVEDLKAVYTNEFVEAWNKDAAE
jgi:NitT/TauT family transport system substrate-binding protein